MTGSRERPARSTWLERPLGSLARFINGEPFKPSDWSDEGLPIVRIENLNDPAAPFHYYRDAPGDKVLIEQGELLLAWSASLGVHWWRRGPALLNQHIFKVVPIENMVSREYLYYALSWALRGLISLTHGGTMHHIQKPALESYQVPCPPLIQQQRIAAKLDEQMAALDRAEKALTERCDATTALQSAVLHSDLDPADRHDWPSVQLGDVCEIRTGKKDVNEGNPSGAFPFFTCAQRPTHSDSYSFDTEAILIAGNGDVGSVKYYKGKFEVYQRTYVLFSFKNADPKFLFSVLCADLRREVQKQKLGNTMPYIKLGMLSSFRIPLPPLEEQSRIAKKLNSISDEIATLQMSLDNQHADLVALRISLLDAAFSGEV